MAHLGSRYGRGLTVPRNRSSPPLVAL